MTFIDPFTFPQKPSIIDEKNCRLGYIMLLALLFIIFKTFF